MASRRASLTLILLVAITAQIVDSTAATCEKQKTCNECFFLDPSCGFCAEAYLCMNATTMAAGACPGPLVSPQSKITAQSTSSSSSAASPDRVTVSLRAKQPLDVPITVTNLRLPLDLYLLQDLSGSFGNDLPVLKNMAPTLISRLSNELSANSYFGVGAFVDKPVLPFGAPSSGDYVFQNFLSLSGDQSAVVSAMNNLVLRNGYDYPEAQWEALQLVAGCANVGWRAQSRRMVLVSTDATFHVRGDGPMSSGISNLDYMLPNNMDCTIDLFEDYPSIGQVKTTLIRNNVIPVFAISGHYADANAIQQYQTAVNALGFGSVQVLSTNSDNLFTTIAAGYAAASSVLKLAAGTDPYSMVSGITPAEGYTGVSIGEKRAFTVTLLYGGASDVPAQSTISLTALGFGSVTITVNLITDCGCTATCPSVGGQVCGGQGRCDCGHCTCQSPWTGSDCTCNPSDTCAALASCSGHGECSCGSCNCSLGWSGPKCDCSTAACPGTGATGCSGHGSCECGVCKCDAGWDKFADCSCTDSPCPGTGATGCSGHGSCSCGQCTCDPFWGGADCSCSQMPCPAGCSGHGTCACGVCQCEAGYGGADCACPTAGCPNGCSGKGNCTCGQCVCDNPALFGGADCSCSQAPCQNGCSGNGVCQCGTCKCNPGFSGADCSCSSAACPKDNKGQTCGGAGNTCSCGECTCANPTLMAGPACNCSTAPCPSSCSGNGVCNCGVCECLPGWSGPDCACSTAACPSDPVLGVCSGRGSCKCGQCTCTDETTWGGEACNCSTAACTAQGGCYPNGVCECGQCKCEPGWGGDDCLCKQGDCPANAAGAICSGHGSCSSNCSVCLCDVGWDLLDDCSCSTAACPATCVEPFGRCECGTCVCNAGYTKPELGCNCLDAPCPGSGVVNNTTPQECSGHGTCDGCGKCTCDAGWSKDDCSCPDAPCPGSCSGHGQCQCGVCTCDDGWSRDDILFPTPDKPDCSCPNATCGPCVNGDCNQCGQCICKAGYTGADCSICNDASCLPTDVCTGQPCGTCLNTTAPGTSTLVCGYCPEYASCMPLTGACPSDLHNMVCPTDTQTQKGAVLSKQQVIGVSVGSAVGIFAVAVLALLAYRGFTYFKDRRDYRLYEQAVADAQWNNNVSPLYAGAHREGENVLYEPRRTN